jgi:MATE family multidrug resistance protein
MAVRDVILAKVSSPCKTRRLIPGERVDSFIASEGIQMRRKDRHEESLILPGVRAGSVKEAWKLAYPTVIGQLSVTVMWTVDTILLGHVGKVELAAAGFGGVLIWTLYTFFVGTIGSVNTFVAQSKGSGNSDRCPHFAWQGLWLALISGLILGLITWKFQWILAAARPAPDVIEECLRYSRARLFGAFFLMGTFTFHNFFRGVGDMKTPMRIAIASNLINILLDLVLIYGWGPFPRLTTLGAGMATAIADVSAFFMGAAVFLGPTLHRKYSTRINRAFRPALVGRMLKVGLPMGVQAFLDMGSFAVFMTIMGRLGTTQLAASQIALQLLSFTFMPADGVAKAATTLVGQYIGAGKKHLAEKSGWIVVKMNLAYSLFIAVFFLLAGEWLYRLFTNAEDVIRAGMAIIPLIALFQLVDAVQMSYSGSLRGAGDTRFTMYVYAGSSWLVFVPLALLFAYPLGMGMAGGWLGGVIHFTLVNIVLTWRFTRGAWKSIEI